MSATGYIQVRTFTSNAQIPLKDVPVVITDTDGSAIAMRLTNRNGQLDTPIAISVPDRSASESPNTGLIPFSIVNIYARAKNFEEIVAEKVQIFADTITVQNLKLIPLSEFPGNWNASEVFDTPAQNL